VTFKILPLSQYSNSWEGYLICEIHYAKTMHDARPCPDLYNLITEKFLVISALQHEDHRHSSVPIHL
jgi:hypothetical protein